MTVRDRLHVARGAAEGAGRLRLADVTFTTSTVRQSTHGTHRSWLSPVPTRRDQLSTGGLKLDRGLACYPEDMKMNRVALVLLLSVGCSSKADGDGGSAAGGSAQGGEAAGGSSQGETFVVNGVSGEDILIDRLWKRGCIPGQNGITWTEASRTLIGRDLTFTLIDYQNGSEAPDCETAQVGHAEIVVHIVPDEVMVPIKWVGPDGTEAPAPDGLAAITSANGITGTMTSATITPDTQERADQLNGAQFCEATDWAPGVGKDVVDCLTFGVNPFKATLIVDDRTMPWLVYDGVGAEFDENGYPIDMANYLPHNGPHPLP